MYKLFFCFLSLADKSIYLTINIYDIILSFIFCGLFPTHKLFPFYIQSDKSFDLTIIFLLILSSISLFVYFYQKTYHSLCHKFYMVLRSFFMILVFIAYFTLIFDFFGNKHESERILEAILWFFLYGFLIFLNIFWSFLLVKLVN